MKGLQTKLDEYGADHQNSNNQLLHWIGIPMIFFSAYALLYRIPIILLDNLAIPLSFLLLFYYFRQSAPLGIGMLLWLCICFYLSRYFVGRLDHYYFWMIFYLWPVGCCSCTDTGSKARIRPSCAIRSRY